MRAINQFRRDPNFQIFINRWTSTKYHEAELLIDHTLKGEDGGLPLRPRSYQSKVLIHMTFRLNKGWLKKSARINREIPIYQVSKLLLIDKLTISMSFSIFLTWVWRSLRVLSCLLPCCLAKAEAQAEWIPLIQLSCSTWDWAWWE